MRILLACLLIGLVCDAVNADEKRPQVLKPWGTVFDLDGDCEFLSINGKLTINVPPTCHDLNGRNGNLNAPRVLREVEGDFDIQVKLTGKFEPGPESTAPKSISFVSGGLLLWGDEKNYVRLERNRMESPSGRSACYPPLFEMCVAGKYSAANPKSTTEKYFEGDSTWLWLERKGQRLRAAVSHDGEDWVFSEEVSKDLPKKLSIGVSAISTSSRPHSVTFEDLQVTLPEKAKE
ncbi:MAG: regulation of enolase protein 1 (concanavalin A-like superfamily) [Planctomycetaceae bacterium]|jgi:regulation of enolase protein 1 (concanavalin A-like superfamily)